jgi:hypothetical protein
VESVGLDTSQLDVCGRIGTQPADPNRSSGWIKVDHISRRAITCDCACVKFHFSILYHITRRVVIWATNV